MEPENQVSSLEPSKKLKELGVKQDSLYYWSSNELHVKLNKDNSNSQVYIVKTSDFSEWYEESEFRESFNDYYSAFTVAELGEMLPDILQENMEDFMSDKSSNEYRVWYADGNSSDYPYNFQGKGNEDNIPAQIDASEADARAKMLIYLIENKLMEIK